MTISLTIFGLIITACQPAATEAPPTEKPAAEEPVAEEPAEPERWEEPIVVGWTPPDITGVFKTATDFFEKSADDGNANGLDITIISQSPATHIDFADQVAIIEDYIERDVDAIAISPIEVEVIKPAVKKANEEGIPVIIVNLLEPIEGLEIDSYNGFDNTVAAEVTAYAILDVFGGPGVLGEGEMVEVAPDQYLDYQFWTNLYSGLSDEDKAAIQAKGAIIEGVAGGFFSTARLNGFHNVMDQYPGIEIVDVPCAADWNREKGIKCTEDILQVNPTDLDFIWAASNEMGLGAMLASEAVDQAILRAGNKRGHFHIGENNRMPPGYGHIPWTEIGAALRSINYLGYVTMEPFRMPGGEVGRDIKVFRDLSEGKDLDAEARKALWFIRGVLK